MKNVYKCEICGGAFNRAFNKNIIPKFCGMKCYGESKKAGGWKWSLEKRERAKGTRTGERSPSWEGGVIFDRLGYKLIRKNKKYIREHRIVMEEKIGRPLKGNEVVHHWDRDVINNSPENLCLFRSHYAHGRLHKFADRHGINVKEFTFNQPWLEAAS